jgi:hypothetical protein
VGWLAVLLAGTAGSYLLGWWLGQPWLLPAFNAAPAWPLLYAALRRGRPGQAIARLSIWALMLGACATALAFWRPETTASLFLNAESYQREMFAWVATGRGPESEPSRFVPVHGAHALLFSLLSLASGSLLSMPMGAVLMNYMGHYVGTFGAASARPGVAILLAWHPWAVVRVGSFVALGVVLAGPVLSRVGRFPFSLRRHRRLLVLASAGLLLDVALKTLLAPGWARVLRAVAGW